ncbi:hypothetical protein AAGF08_14135 [Algoriphagus sp. SE2]|uniref:hypothetical protein n=1 Tax=Algoriphagus sp. SE2 TaxID=3141536 RepID=UPI0031CD12C9
MKNVIMSILTGLVIFLLITCENKTPEIDIFEIQGQKGFAGKLIGIDAYVGLLIADDEAIIYVCNGDIEISEWLKGPIINPYSFDLRNSSGTNVHVRFIDNSLEGSVTFSNENTFKFTASPLREEGAGIYRVVGEMAKEDQIEAGWILNSEDDQHGSLTIRSSFQNTPMLSTTDNSNFIQLDKKSYPVNVFMIGATLTNKKQRKIFIDTYLKNEK